MTESITSIHNPRVKAAGRLRERRGRERDGRFLIDGVREISRALDAGVTPLEVFACPELCASPAATDLLRRLSSTPATMLHVTPAVFAKLAYGERDEGLVVAAAVRSHELAQLTLPPQALVVVVEGVEKPGNLGAILRTADAAGASAVIAAGGVADFYNPNCIRASLGTVFSLPLAAAPAEETLAWLRRQGLRIFATRVDAREPYTAADFTGPAAIVLGSEDAGLTPQWHAEDVAAIRVPMHGIADSLNVSATAAILLYEAVRQRA